MAWATDCATSPGSHDAAYASHVVFEVKPDTGGRVEDVDDDEDDDDDSAEGCVVMFESELELVGDTITRTAMGVVSFTDSSM